jgi:hypothetical protein
MPQTPRSAVLTVIEYDESAHLPKGCEFRKRIRPRFKALRVTARGFQKHKVLERLHPLTVTPLHGDEEHFAPIIPLIDPGGYSRNRTRPEGATAAQEDLTGLYGLRLFPDRLAHTVTFKPNHEEFNFREGRDGISMGAVR